MHANVELAGQEWAPIYRPMPGEHEPMRPIIRKLMHDALQVRRVRARTRDRVWHRDRWLMIDAEAGRRDEAFARKLRDWKRRYRESGGVDCKFFFEWLGPAVIEDIEHNLVARKLVRDFFTERRARQARRDDEDAR
jgi:hypothetical protein